MVTHYATALTLALVGIALAGISFSIPPPLSLVALLIGLALLPLAWHRYHAASRAQVGVQSERRVTASLTQSGLGGWVFNSVQLKRGGDVDHVVVLQDCHTVIAIETKTGFGNVRYDGRLWAGRRAIPGDPIRQARRAGSEVSRALGGVEVCAVVCIPDAFLEDWFDVGGVPVVTSELLPQFLHVLSIQYPRPWDSDHLSRVLRQLKRTL